MLRYWKQRRFPLSISSPNIRNDDYEEDYLGTNDPGISKCNLSEIMIYLTCNYWGKKEKQINDDYDVTGWMLCVMDKLYVECVPSM